MISMLCHVLLVFFPSFFFDVSFIYVCMYFDSNKRHYSGLFKKL